MKKRIIIVFGICFLTFACIKTITEKEGYERVMDLYSSYKTDFPGVPDILVEELANKNQKIIFVDNREPEEIEISMIPGAITGKEFLANAEGYDDSIIVAYCTIGSRSGLFAKRQREKAIKVYNLKGGVLAWAHAGRTFVDSRGKQTTKVHVYGSKWDLLPEGYQSIW